MVLGHASIYSFLRARPLVSKACVTGESIALLQLMILHDHPTLLRAS